MKASELRSERQQAVHRAKTLLWILGASLVLNLMLAYGTITNRARVVLVPPYPEDRFEITMESANAAYAKAWGLFAATTVGNFSPARKDAVLGALDLILSPRLYTEERQEIMAQAKTLAERGGSIAFYPYETVLETVEDGVDTVFVTGERVETTAAGNKVETQVTYEFQIRINYGRPEITEFDLYEGPAHTLEWEARNARTNAN